MRAGLADKKPSFRDVFTAVAAFFSLGVQVRLPGERQRLQLRGSVLQGAPSSLMFQRPVSVRNRS